uniref:Uncharacterized protein n=1 Tax=Pseudomonas phage RVTF4 TaxID=3236931 RepID=A0AB39CD20_9VIRU
MTMNQVNHFVRVDIVWSFNMIGGMKGVDDVDMRVLNDVYSKAGAFLVARHSFHMSGNNIQYNGFLHALREHFDSYNMGSSYFINFYEALFRSISPALAQITTPITGCYPMTNATGDIEGFVFVAQ